MITDWQKLPKFIVLIGSFVFYWVLLNLMLKSVSVFDTDCLHVYCWHRLSHINR